MRGKEPMLSAFCRVVSYLIQVLLTAHSLRSSEAAATGRERFTSGRWTWVV